MLGIAFIAVLLIAAAVGGIAYARASRMSLLPEMARIATEMVTDVLRAFVERDAQAAIRVCERDQAVDDFYDSIFRTLLTHMMESPQSIGQSAHLLFVAKNLERVGDHATNIAEMVYYAATGDYMAEPNVRKKRQKTV